MNAIWIDRAGKGWQDDMMPGQWNEPTETVKSLDQVVATVLKVTQV